MSTRRAPLTLEEHRARHLRIIALWLIGNMIAIACIAASRLYPVLEVLCR